MEHQQLDLSLHISAHLGSREEGLVMDATTLIKWKTRIIAYQQTLREIQLPEQVTLFEVAPSHCCPEQIDPFRLHLQPMAFYRMPDTFGQAALYFVIDSASDLLLYIGETCRSHQRWKGVHDCKNYLASYQDLHYRYDLKTAVNIGFWWDAPLERRPRQKLEQAMIQKWRSPMNKEMWSLWGQPFK